MAEKGKSAKASTAPLTEPNFFRDPQALQQKVHGLHDALCDYVQKLNVGQKRPVFELMTQTAHLPQRCDVFCSTIGLPLGSFAVYRLLKGGTR